MYILAFNNYVIIAQCFSLLSNKRKHVFSWVPCCSSAIAAVSSQDISRSFEREQHWLEQQGGKLHAKIKGGKWIRLTFKFCRWIWMLIKTEWRYIVGTIYKLLLWSCSEVHYFVGEDSTKIKALKPASNSVLFFFFKFILGSWTVGQDGRSLQNRTGLTVKACSSL